MNFNHLSVGDHVVVEYMGGGRFKGGRLTGKITRIWTPQEHSVGCWQGQVNGGWCFHAEDKLIEHNHKKQEAP